MNEFCQDHWLLPDLPVPCRQVERDKSLINADEPTDPESSGERQEQPSPRMDQRGLEPLSQLFLTLHISWISLSTSLAVSMCRKDNGGTGKSIFLPVLLDYPLLHPPPGELFPAHPSRAHIPTPGIQLRNTGIWSGEQRRKGRRWQELSRMNSLLSQGTQCQEEQ